MFSRKKRTIIKHDPDSAIMIATIVPVSKII
jgi:hypothetical protein